MSEPREYPAAALEALARRLVVDRYGKAMATVVLADDDLRIGRVALAALAAMSPEDRAALARWLSPEATTIPRSMERMRAALTGDEAAAIEAATVKRIATWLRNAKTCGSPPGPETWAFAIEREFGGTDAR